MCVSMTGLRGSTKSHLAVQMKAPEKGPLQSREAHGDLGKSRPTLFFCSSRLLRVLWLVICGSQSSSLSGWWVGDPGLGDCGQGLGQPLFTVLLLLRVLGCTLGRGTPGWVLGR